MSQADWRESRYLEFCQATARPYFGRIMSALQGDPTRHPYMVALVEWYWRQRRGSAVRILEVGSWAGGSALTWAQALQRIGDRHGMIVCVDSWRPYFDPLQPSRAGPIYQAMSAALHADAIFDLFLHNIRAAGQTERIIPIRGSSHDVLPLLSAESFDVVYLDSDHAYDVVRQELVDGARLVRDGGVLCGDDLEAQITDVDRELTVAHRSDDYLQDPATGAWYHPGVTLALGEAFGEISAWNGFWAIQRRRDGWASIDLPVVDEDPDGVAPHLRRPMPHDWNAVARWLIGRRRWIGALRVVGLRTAVRRGVRRLVEGEKRA